VRITLQLDSRWFSVDSTIFPSNPLGNTNGSTCLQVDNSFFVSMFSAENDAVNTLSFVDRFIKLSRAWDLMISDNKQSLLMTIS
jgi:hypothetical protein